MKRLILSAVFLATGLAATAASADTPSFNFLQLQAQHVDTPVGDNWGWGLKGSFNPYRGLFISGKYLHTKFSDTGNTNLENYRLNVGYEKGIADTLAVYGQVGWSGTKLLGERNGGGVAGVGVRANLISILEFGVSASHHFWRGGFDEYSADVSLHVFAFTYVTVGVSKFSDASPFGDSERWHAGVRLTF